MKQIFYKITENKPIATNVYRMVLESDTTDIYPGQFVNIKLSGKYLRRPISVCDIVDNKLVIIYKVVGTGTKLMSSLVVEDYLDVLTGLGNGYNLEKSGNSPLLIGGGVGVPPMYYLAKELINEGKSVTVILGFNTADEIFYEEEFKALGCDVYVTTVDGSYGIKGFVTNAMDKVEYSYVYCCGPEPMLKAIYSSSTTDAQFSFEERMGCGFGACMGCSCHTITGNKRICTDGPVMYKEEIIW